MEIAKMRWKLDHQFENCGHPSLTMFHIIIFDDVTPYMHFTIHKPSHLYKKVTKNMFEKKSGLPLKLLL